MRWPEQRDGSAATRKSESHRGERSSDVLVIFAVEPHPDLGRAHIEVKLQLGQAVAGAGLLLHSTTILRWSSVLAAKANTAMSTG